MIGSVVVLYNPTEDEIKNINTYESDVEFIVIVDNSEIDNSELIKKNVDLNASVIYYTEKKNLGLCKGFNIGVGILKEKKCDWALLFDADSKLGSDIISVYKKALKDYENQSVAIFAPVHVFDRSKHKPYDGYKEIDWSMTSGWLINIDIFKKQNGFFEELFVDGLDMDYCFKSHKNGYGVIECGNAVIKHNPAETKSTKLGFKYGIASPYRYYMQARQLIWNSFHYSKVKMFGIYLYKWFKVVFLFPNKGEYINNMFKGTIEGIRLSKYSRR